MKGCRKLRTAVRMWCRGPQAGRLIMLEHSQTLPPAPQPAQPLTPHAGLALHQRGHHVGNIAGVEAGAIDDHQAESQGEAKHAIDDVEEAGLLGAQRLRELCGGGMGGGGECSGAGAILRRAGRGTLHTS